MKKYKTLAPYVLIILVVMSNISESIFSLFIPSIKIGLNISSHSIERLITSNLLGFTIGMLSWGHIADRIGRKRAWSLGVILAALSLYIMYFSQSLFIFYIARFIQGLASSVSSVMSLIIIRDWYTSAQERSKMHALINQSLSLAPVIGVAFSYLPIFNENWHNGFIVLAIIYTTMFVMMQFIHISDHVPSKTPLLKQTLEVLKVKTTIYSIILIGICIGFAKCYFSEMPIVLNNLLGSNLSFKYSLVGVSLAWITGAKLANYFSHNYGQHIPLYIGALWVGVCTTALLITSLLPYCSYTAPLLIVFSITTMVGTGVIIPNAMALSMEAHAGRAGVASSIIGFGFYMISTSMQFILTFSSDNNSYSIAILFAVSSAIIAYVCYLYHMSSTETVDKSVENLYFTAPNLDD